MTKNILILEGDNVSIKKNINFYIIKFCPK